MGAALFVESVITDLGLLSEFREMKTKRGRASKKCHKKAARKDSRTHYLELMSGRGAESPEVSPG
jgi:hypothetical protein